MKNQKGFVIEGALLYLLVGVASIAVVALTPLGNLFNVHAGGEGQKSVQSQSYKETIEPVLENGQPVKVQLQDGSEGLIFKRVKSSNSLDEQTQPKLSIWQRLKQVGWWWVALTIAGMFFAPLGLIMNTINGKAKQAALALADQIKKKHQDLASEAQRIVLSVDEGLNVFDTAINAAKASVDAATTAAAATADPQLLAANHALMNTYQAVLKAITDLKVDFLSALKTKQDESTKLLVPQLRSGTPTI